MRVKRWWDGRNLKNNLAGEAIARQRESRGSQRKEKQQGKNGKKKGNRSAPPVAKTDEHSTPQEAKPQQQEREQDVPVAPTEGKKKTNKKNKKNKPGRPHLEQQDLGEAAAVPDDTVKEEEAGAITLQSPEQEQQLLATSAPPDEEIQGGTTTAAEAESETSTPFSPLPDRDDEEEDVEEGEESPADGEDKEMIPDEAFLLEGASSTLVCSISFKHMTSAVVAMDTHSYKKEALEAWIGRCKSKGRPLTSPLTSAPMEPQMMANQALRVLVGEHIETRERVWREQLADRRKLRLKERKKAMKKEGAVVVGR